MEKIKEITRFYSKEIKETKDRQEKMIKYFLNVRTRNLEYLRTFWLHLTIISSLIIVAVLPLVLKNSNFFKCLIITIIGLSFLTLMIILACFSLNHILTKENRDLSEKSEFYSKNFLEEIKIINEGSQKQEAAEDYSRKYFNLSEKFKGEENQLDNKLKENKFYKWFNNHISDILVGLLILGITSIIISMISPCWIR